MKQRIRAVSGPTSGSVHSLGNCTVIGRSGDTDVQVLGKGVSREHAYIIKNEHAKMVLIDMSSKNGTYVGDVAIRQHELVRGDRFRIGESEFVYEQVAELEHPDPMELKLLSGPAAAVTSVDEETAELRLVEVR